MVKSLPAKAGDAGDTGSIPGSGRSPGGGNGNPLQHSHLENPMDRGAWRGIVHGVAKNRTWLRNGARMLENLVLGVVLQTQASPEGWESNKHNPFLTEEAACPKSQPDRPSWSLGH